MRIHHINCGSMRPIEDEDGASLPTVCHCLLIETDRLRELVRVHGAEVTVFASHDPWELARLRS